MFFILFGARVVLVQISQTHSQAEDDIAPQYGYSVVYSMHCCCPAPVKLAWA